MNMSAADDPDTLQAKARQAYEHWKASYPKAVDELEQIQVRGAVPDELQAWKRDHPDAARMFGQVILNSEDVVRKMRMTDPAWEPPESQQ